VADRNETNAAQNLWTHHLTLKEIEMWWKCNEKLG
jgi:hypothetical protein